MNKIAKLYIEKGIIRDLCEKGIITEGEMNLAILEINNELMKEELNDEQGEEQ